MKRTDLWRLLALILALVMVLGCLAGCDGNDAGNDDDDDDDEVEDLRDGLEKHEYDGLTFYLGKDFDGEDGRWISDDMTVVVETAPISALHGEVETVKELRDYMVEMYEEVGEGTPETGKKNGVHYLIAENGDETAVIGLYLKGNAFGVISVISEDFDEYEDDMILYATLGELKDYYKDENEDESQDEGKDESKPQASRPPMNETIAASQRPSDTEEPEPTEEAVYDPRPIE